MNILYVNFVLPVTHVHMCIALYIQYMCCWYVKRHTVHTVCAACMYSAVCAMCMYSAVCAMCMYSAVCAMCMYSAVCAMCMYSAVCVCMYSTMQNTYLCTQLTEHLRVFTILMPFPVSYVLSLSLWYY